MWPKQANAAFIPSVTCEDDHIQRSYDIFSRLLRDRGIMFSGQVDDTLSDLIIAQLLHLASENHTAEITMYINSPGGSVTAALAIYDVMRYISVPVHTICIGQACSAASLILCAGDKRMIMENARILLHQPSGGISGQAEDMKRGVHEILKLSEIIEKIYLRHTKIPKDDLMNILDRDTIIRGDEAIKLGLVDEIVQPMPKKIPKDNLLMSTNNRNGNSLVEEKKNDV